MSYYQSIYTMGLPHRAVAVYMYLKDRSNQEGNGWPAIPTMSQELGLSRSTVKRAIKDLERAGCIKSQARYRENGSYTSNLYQLLV